MWRWIRGADRSWNGLLILSALVAMTPRPVRATVYTAIDLYTLTAPNTPGGFQIDTNNSAQFAAGGSVVAFGYNDPFRQSFGGGHALLWQGNGTAIDLEHSVDFGPDGSTAFGTDGVHQVGHVSSGGPFFSTASAALWNGTYGSRIDLTPTLLPTAFSTTTAVGVAGGQQVGNGILASDNSKTHALLWRGSGDSAVDLNPTTISGVTASRAFGTDGIHQVGVGGSHALLWNGTPDSVIDLSPTNLTGFTSSQADGVSGNQQAGFGSGPRTSSKTHALIWSSSGNTAVDLHPTNLTGLVSSIAHGTNGSQQVGIGVTAASVTHALLWNGSPNSAVDLHALLPGSPASSNASTIDAAGNAYGIATYGTTTHAVAWAPIFSQFSSAAIPLVAGIQQSVSVPNFSAHGGGVDVTFTSVGSGSFSANYDTESALALQAATGPFNFNPVNLTGIVQEWDPAAQAAFTTAQVTLHYDPTLLPAGLDPLTLHPFHFTGGSWVELPGTIDPAGNTVTFTTSSFSPFTIGTELPEPSLTAFMMLGIAGLLRRRPRAVEEDRRT